MERACTNSNRKKAFKKNKQGSFCFHLGVLVFAPFFNKMKDMGLDYIRQWLVAILLGCQNIEQNKELNYTSIEKMIGKAPRTLRLQRISLRNRANPENTYQVLLFNARILNIKEQRDFYYDPHTKHYTGDLKTLATWCPSVRLADKGINMDYVHTVNGHPVYFDTDDNFYDLRERFKPNIEKFRSLFGFHQQSVLTWVIDRGIYSMDVFADITKSPFHHIITWEKNYNKDQWDENTGHGKGCIEKKKNNKSDIKLVHYRYQQKQWAKDTSMRQIIVRIYNKNWKVLIEVSILSDDKDRPANQVIELMLTRWVQENDFKYMIKHFGINQLTSYAFTDYKDLKDKLEDKVYICYAHKALTKEIHQVRTKLKTALLRKHKFEEKHNNTDKEITKKETKRKNKIWNTVSQLNTKLEKLEQERKNTTKYVSKIDELVENGYKKLDTNTKNFMDAIKILARNIFYLTFEPFKEQYNNYRDDHVLFRNLTRSHGIMEYGQGKVELLLTPQMEYQPKLKNIITNLLENINQKDPKMIDGSGRKIKLKLKT